MDGQKDESTAQDDSANSFLKELVNSSPNVSNSTRSTKPDDEMDLGSLLWVSAGPVIFCVGLCGNILILLVMRRRRMRGTSTSVYLTLMAIADSCVLLTGMIPEVLEAADVVVFKQIHPATCKLEKFSFYTSADTAVWILMIFTVDRFIAVCFPMQKRKFCLPTRAKMYSAGALSIAIIKNVHVFWTRGAEYKVVDGEQVLRSNCGRPTPEFNYFESFVRPWIAFTVVSIVPFCVIFLCNVFIVRALVKVKRMRQEHKIVSSSDKSLVQMTAMCLSASFCFLICVAPSIVLLIGKPYWNKKNEAYVLAKAINNQLVYVNHSINFFLYCITGKRFRQAILSICCRYGPLRYSDSTLDSLGTRTSVYKLNSSPESTMIGRTSTTNAYRTSMHVGRNPTDQVTLMKLIRDKPGV